MRRVKKSIRVQRREENLTSTRAIDALIGDEEQTGEMKKEQKERDNSFYFSHLKAIAWKPRKAGGSLNEGIKYWSVWDGK